MFYVLLVKPQVHICSPITDFVSPSFTLYLLASKHLLLSSTLQLLPSARLGLGHEHTRLPSTGLGLGLKLALLPAADIYLLPSNEELLSSAKSRRPLAWSWEPCILVSVRDGAQRGEP